MIFCLSIRVHSWYSVDLSRDDSVECIVFQITCVDELYASHHMPIQCSAFRLCINIYY